MIDKIIDQKIITPFLRGKHFQDCLNQPNLKQVTGLAGALPLFAGLYSIHGPRRLPSSKGSPDLLITASVLEAEEVLAKINFFLGNKISTFLYPPIEELPYEMTYLSKTTSLQRLYVRQKMVSDRLPSSSLVITTIKAVNEKIIHPDFFLANRFKVEIKQWVSPKNLAEQLEKLGYLRETEARNLGSYALRNEILEVYCPQQLLPVRIYFFGDEIEEIRTFSLESGETVENLNQVEFFPPFEWSYPLAIKKKWIEKLRSMEKGDHQLEKFEERFLYDSNHFSFSGVMPLLDSKLASIFDYLPSWEEMMVFLKDQEKLQQQDQEVRQVFKNAYQIKKAENLTSLSPVDDLFFDFFKNKTFKQPSIRLIELSSWKHLEDETSADFHVKAVPSFKRKFGSVVDYFKQWLGECEENLIFLFVGHLKAAEKMEQTFRQFNPVIMRENESGSLKGRFFISCHPFKQGFRLEKQLMICDYELFGKKPKQLTFIKDTVSEVIENFSDLKENDWVVHLNHGVGIYRGLERIKLSDKEKDYLKIEYRGKSKLFVPVEQMNLVQKYISAKGQSTQLDQLGGKAWDKVKNRVRKNLADLAEKLLVLYRKRRDYKVPPCREDDYLQNEFEMDFSFQETEDQLKVTEEIKQDMMRDYPMERLLCADVGFGKTEVALRAVLKTILSGRQALFLVPTTILSRQHYQNIIERFKNFPVTVEVLNRFKTKNQGDEILNRIKSGTIDLLVATHKVLSKKVHFKKLGLLVIDEEQKFGVKQKESLKEKYPHVDTLSLSATPIPRTLHMSLSSIRDISIINMPPSDRLPIKTYVAEFEDHLVKRAIEQERLRGGQIFFVENRIETLPRLNRHLKQLVPSLKIGVIHGQMEGDQIGEVLDRFVGGKLDLLLSTAIIDSGIDLHNVNTLLVHRADRFGLTQLYQMKGRVGRSDRQAYAYFFTAPDQVISEDATKRLEALDQYTQLGDGFKIAMRDLEIRGPGNVLGAEQSGNVMAVGFELYTKLLNEAVEKLAHQPDALPSSDQEQPDKLEQSFFLGTLVDLQYHGFIPTAYLEDHREKLSIYKKIASLETWSKMEKLQQTIEEKYGSLVPEMKRLFTVARIKIWANRLRIFSVKEKINSVEFEMTKESKVDRNKILLMLEKRKINLVDQDQGKFSIPIQNQKNPEKKITPFEKKISLIEEVLNQIEV